MFWGTHQSANPSWWATRSWLGRELGWDNFDGANPTARTQQPFVPLKTLSVTQPIWTVPTADARDGRRGNQPWSVITTPVSA